MVHEAEVGSTNDRVLALVRERGVAAPLALRADAQTAGRGRLGRAWASPPGGVWVSVAWPVGTGSTPYELAPVLAGLATLDTVVGSLSSGSDIGAGGRLRLKWPNDVLVDGRKLAGVLCERPGAFEVAGCRWLVVGVGVNLDTPIVHDPFTGVVPIGWRAAFATPADAATLASVLVEAIAAKLRALETDPPSAAARARADAERVLAYRGERVRVSIPDRPDRAVEGEAVGLDAELRLLVRTSDVPARTLACDAGEVGRVRPVAALTESVPSRRDEDTRRM